MTVKELKELIASMPDGTEIELAIGDSRIHGWLFKADFAWFPQENRLEISVPNFADDE